MKQPKGFTTSVLIVIVIALLILGALGYFIFVKKIPGIQPTNSSTSTSESPTPSPVTQQDLNSVLELSQKEAGTKIYYSDALGVGFTYLPPAENPSLEIMESGSTITLKDQSIEVFTKDPKRTLAEAIQDKFLSGYNPSECFVKMYETSEQKLLSYLAAGISFPPTSDPNAPWWQNSDKCPKNYSETNGVQYFLMNQDVPGKFLFVQVGQYSAASDGTPKTPEGGFNWTHSIRILK